MASGLTIAGIGAVAFGVPMALAGLVASSIAVSSVAVRLVGAPPRRDRIAC